MHKVIDIEHLLLYSCCLPLPIIFFMKSFCHTVLSSLSNSLCGSIPCNDSCLFNFRQQLRFKHQWSNRWCLFLVDAIKIYIQYSLCLHMQSMWLYLSVMFCSVNGNACQRGSLSFQGSWKIVKWEIVVYMYFVSSFTSLMGYRECRQSLISFNGLFYLMLVGSTTLNVVIKLRIFHFFHIVERKCSLIKIMF